MIFDTELSLLLLSSIVEACFLGMTVFFLDEDDELDIPKLSSKLFNAALTPLGPLTARVEGAGASLLPGFAVLSMMMTSSSSSSSMALRRDGPADAEEDGAWRAAIPCDVHLHRGDAEVEDQLTSSLFPAFSR